MPKIRVSDAGGDGGGLTGAGTLGVMTKWGALNTLLDAGVTETELLDSILLESANAEHIPTLLQYNESYPVTCAGDNFIWRPNAVGANFYFYSVLPLPTTRVSLKLYVSGWELGLFDSDANDYVKQIIVMGMDFTGATAIDNENNGGAGWGAGGAGRYVHTFTPVDCSSYELVRARLVATVNLVTDIEIAFFNLLCHYSTT